MLGAVTNGNAPSGFFTAFTTKLFSSTPSFSQFPSGCGFGARQSPFLQVDRLSSIQKSADTDRFTGAIFARLGTATFSADVLAAGAAVGSAECAFSLGVMRHAGIGVARDAILGTELIRLAAVRGLPAARYAHGLCLRVGAGVEADAGRSARELRLSAEAGFDEAMFAYGCSLLGGVGVRRDEKSAFKFFRRAAERGHSPAMLWEGICLHDGLGVAMDKARAVMLFQKASSRGVVGAAQALKMIAERDAKAMAREGKRGEAK
jgi:TPR repeat protein